jgi:hypothetical protein
MNKKVLIIGAITLVGIGVGAYFIFRKPKKDKTSDSGGTKMASAETSTEESAEETKESTSATSSTSTDTSTAKKPLTTRKEKRTACGKRPLGGKKLQEWKKCVAEGGKASFDGHDYDDKMDYSMFEGVLTDIDF